MSKQVGNITLGESNLAPATKKEYLFRVGKFYEFAPIKSDGTKKRKTKKKSSTRKRK